MSPENATSPWLDRVFAIPAIGIVVRPVFGTRLRHLDLLAPFVEGLQKEHGDDGVTIEVLPSPEIRLQISDGFKLRLQPENFIIEFNPQASVKINFADPLTEPKIERTPIAKYTDLLAGAVLLTERLMKQVGRSHHFLRIGVMAITLMKAATDPPPGVAQYLTVVKQPWEPPIVKIDSSIVAKLASRETAEDRCHHILRVGDARTPEAFHFTLDWQRVYLKPTFFDPAPFATELRACVTAAIGYFGKFGEGVLKI